MSMIHKDCGGAIVTRVSFTGWREYPIQEIDDRSGLVEEADPCYESDDGDEQFLCYACEECDKQWFDEAEVVKEMACEGEQEQQQ